MIKYYIIIMTFIGAMASLYLKKASESEGMVGILKNINLYIGGIFYLVSAGLNIYVLRFLDYSVVLPLTSITYVWTMFLSFLLLGEKINLKKVVGVVLIVIGAAVISI